MCQRGGLWTFQEEAEGPKDAHLFIFVLDLAHFVFTVSVNILTFLLLATFYRKEPIDQVDIFLVFKRLIPRNILLLLNTRVCLLLSAWLLICLAFNFWHSLSILYKAVFLKVSENFAIATSSWSVLFMFAARFVVLKWSIAIWFNLHYAIVLVRVDCLFCHKERFFYLIGISNVSGRSFIRYASLCLHRIFN